LFYCSCFGLSARPLTKASKGQKKSCDDDGGSEDLRSSCGKRARSSSYLLDGRRQRNDRALVIETEVIGTPSASTVTVFVPSPAMSEVLDATSRTICAPIFSNLSSSSRSINIAVETVVEELKKNSKKVTSNDEIAQVGTISANGDQEIGRFLAEAMKKVGYEAVITVEETKSPETELDVVKACSSTALRLAPVRLFMA